MAAADDHIAVRVGNRTVEYAVRSNGEMPAKDFVESLPLKTQHRILASFHHVALTAGRDVSPMIFQHERDEIWTFKCKDQKRRLRLPCFQRDQRWIVTHGFVKPPQARWPEQHFTLAFEIMREVITREAIAEKRPKRNP
jgi:hypothetical protein